MIHLIRDGSLCHCGRDLNVDDAASTTEPGEAECPDCIEAWEIEPQPVTTEHLAEVVDLMRQLSEVTFKTSHPNITSVHTEETQALLDRLQRPRSHPRGKR